MVAKKGGAEAEVLVEDIEPALVQQPRPQRTHVVIHQLLRGGQLEPRAQLLRESGGLPGAWVGGGAGPLGGRAGARRNRRQQHG